MKVIYPIDSDILTLSHKSRTPFTMASNGKSNADAEIKTDIITLTRYLTEAQHDLGSYATGDFTCALPPFKTSYRL